MINFFNNKFDIIFSIGEDCACTSYLRRCNLQHNSYPFDWLTNAPFENRISLICKNFKNFINIENLKSYPKKAHNENEKIFDLYENTLNGFHFYHDFPVGIPLTKSFEQVKDKYQRRIKRFYKQIDISQKILFVWLSHSKSHNSYEVINEYKRLKDKFENKEIFLLCIENRQINSQEFFENNHVLIIHQDTLSDDKKHHYN